jgi:alpha-L-fucosidase
VASRYWWWLNEGPSGSVGVYDYQLEKYGPHVVYDDFIQNFTVSAWDPKEWVDLFADAGANYFVQVSKHHEGYALFDLPENVTKRTSVAMTPHRNLLQVRRMIVTSCLGDLTIRRNCLMQPKSTSLNYIEQRK